MKRIIFNFAIIMFVGVLFFALNAEKQEKANTSDTQAKIVKEEGKKIVGTQPVPIDPDHKYKSIDCKSCHDCEYPTANDPCLKSCPRSEVISIFHSPNEGPEIVEMDAIPGNYGSVLFTHKLHAQMSVMSGGCETCHHYNTTGPVLKCSACHEDRHLRENIAVPALEAAYHRQCLDCHRQWSGHTDCNYCHIADGQDIEQVRHEKLMKYTGLDHPELHEPMKVVYETEHKDAPIVTFFHDEHVHLFKQDCASCHHDENCIKCHNLNTPGLRGTDNLERHSKPHKSFEDHHDPCSSCHDIDNCQKCHKTEEMSPFDHAITTGFDIKKYHSKVNCENCHKNNKYEGLNASCSSCHKFNAGNFKHEVTGLKLDEMHSDLECSDCHKNNNFGKTDCSDCHDGFVYPSKKPGKIIR